MRITVLTENTSRCGFPTEHGLSLYVESGQQHFLFDTGQTALFSENAERLGIDLGRMDFAVLSHGHYDHGGGIMYRSGSGASIFRQNRFYGRGNADI